jgi:hypothetical protein
MSRQGRTEALTARTAHAELSERVLRRLLSEGCGCRHPSQTRGFSASRREGSSMGFATADLTGDA